MRSIVLFLALACLVACATAGFGRGGGGPPRSTGPTFPRPSGGHRFRREASPQGSVVVQAQKNLDGPDRRPTVDVNYNRRIFDGQGGSGDVYAGSQFRPGQRPSPHAGFQYERNYKNGFIRAHGQLERGPGSRYSPAAGIQGGFRFRREADASQQENIVDY